MARAHRVASSRASTRPKVCGACGQEIKPPEGYYWAAPGFRASKKFRHLNHPFKASELTTSLVSEALSAQEDFDDALGEINADNGQEALDQITVIVEEFASAIREYADQRRESADAWENGNSQLEEYAEIAETAADEIEGFEVEEWQGDESHRDWDPEAYPEPEDEDSDEWAEWDEARQNHDDAVDDFEQHVASQIDAASEMSSSLSF